MKDCLDGADEQHCNPHTHPLPLCGADESPCADGKLCVPIAKLCDGVVDCPDHSDEQLCPNKTVSILQCHHDDRFTLCGADTCVLRILILNFGGISTRRWRLGDDRANAQSKASHRPRWLQWRRHTAVESASENPKNLRTIYSVGAGSIPGLAWPTYTIHFPIYDKANQIKMIYFIEISRIIWNSL